MTLKQLAEISGFSVGTVSKAFADSNEISSDTKKKIFEIAKQHKCFDKFNVRKFHKPIIGVIIPSVNEYKNTIKLLDKEICSNKGILALFVSHSIKKAEAELVDLCIRFKRTDGVIIVNPLSDYIGDRIVSMNISPHSSPDLSDAIKLLKNGGHTRISFIGSTSGSFNSVLFKNILADNGIRSGNNYYAESDVSSELGGYETMEYLFGMPSIPTAVIAETDTMAMGAEKYILKRGLKVPKDISVIGLESSSFSENSILECKSAVTGIFKKMKAYYKR